MKELKYSFYPGCTLKTKAKELEKYALMSAEALGFSMEEIEDWQCCGGAYPLGRDQIAAKLSSVRALTDAKNKGLDIITVCSACFNVLKQVNNEIIQNSDFRTRANNYLKLDEEYQGETRVYHYLEVLRDVVGFERIRQMVKKPLTGMKIGAYYGCLLLRPSNVMAFDNPENPKILEDFIRALGAEPVIYPYRNECCGGYIALDEKKRADEMSDSILKSAKGFGADMLVTACPLCMYNLKSVDKLPVVYFTELLALALGLKEDGE